MSDGRLKHSRAVNGGNAAAMSPTRFAPLRKIDREENNEHGSVIEVLACGHKLRPRHDMIGTTYTERRRCVECLRATCSEEGHKLVDWFSGWNGRAFMRCKCTAVKADEPVLP